MKKITQTKAIRLRCIDCAETKPEIRECTIKECPLWPGRMGKRPKGFQPLKAIREYCLWCCNGNTKEVRECPIRECVLWPFRFGMKYETYLRRKDENS